MVFNNPSIYDQDNFGAPHNLFRFNMRMGNAQTITNKARQTSEQYVQLVVSPLVLDLDGDGVETAGVNNNWVMFDLDGDGVKNRTGWLRPDDGFLVFDRDGDGLINNGREMFGNYIVRYS